MGTILDEIVEKTKDDLNKRRKKVHFSDFRSFEWYEDQRRDFGGRIGQQPGVGVIAEVKKASPSKGVIRPDFDAVDIARQYDEAGAAAISVLTDVPFFQGELDFLSRIRPEVEAPLLRKDFIIDPYQVEEARAYGADAVLLIATITEGNQLPELLHATQEAELQALVECYHEQELLNLPWKLVDIVGVNNRDLNTFKVNVHRGIEILQQAPDDTITVSESGLTSSEDLDMLFEADIHGALIGEHLVRQPKPGLALKQMLDEHHHRSLDTQATEEME
ncbi:MAG: indole-3-glycerol phosphate synthase TrpC [Bacteroidota bacterium]